jgi:hypothetical protein
LFEELLRELDTDDDELLRDVLDEPVDLLLLLLTVVPEVLR